MRAQLDVELHRAHERGDGPALARLYREAGEQALARQDIDAGCFWLTQAYVHALESGEQTLATELHRTLMQHDREQ